MDMRITLITQKPNTARVVARVAHSLWPQHSLEHVVCWPTGLYVPALPRGLQWKDYPFIASFEEHKFKRRSEVGLTSMNMPLVSNWANDELHFGGDWERFEGHINQADRLVFVADGCHSVYHMEVICRKILGRPARMSEIGMITSLDAPAITRALAGSDKTSEHYLARLVEQGRTRRYFDYQFTLNSLAILGAWLGHGGGWVSKYQLQLLYALRNQEPAHVGKWWTRMHQWKGTGKYCLNENSPLASLGSAMSIGSIFDQVTAHGWVHSEGGNANPLLRLSRKGATLLDRLHPGCEDADLPYRLRDWALLGLEESRPHIDRYIRTFFGRQKRFMDQRGKSHHP
jgi:hypothetical protein